MIILVGVLTILPYANLSLNFSKFVFAAPSTDFLGVILDHTGIQPLPSKSEAISNAAATTNMEILCSFLGLTVYLRDYVTDCSITAAALTYLLRTKSIASKRTKETLTEWGQPRQAAFRTLEWALSNLIVLAFLS